MPLWLNVVDYRRALLVVEGEREYKLKFELKAKDYLTSRRLESGVPPLALRHPATTPASAPRSPHPRSILYLFS